MRLNLFILLILCIFGYSINANMIIEQRLDGIDREIVDIKSHIKQEKRFVGIRADLQRIMDIYGTRLTIVEKGIKQYHNFETLDDLTGPRKGG